jgi:peptide/nickel transport system permease protein
MGKHILARIITLIAIGFGVAILVFISLRVVPGDAAVVLLEEMGDPIQLQALRDQLGLDDPIPIQFLRWLKSFASPDWGRSLRTNLPVRDEVLRRVPPTVQLAFSAIILSILLGIPSGVLSATRRNSSLDLILRFVSFVGLSIPSFWLAILLILFLSVRLNFFPPIGFAGFWDEPWSAVKFTALPALALAIPQAAMIMRFTRSALLEILRQDYVRTARSKGLGEKTVIYKHAIRNAMITVVTVIGIQMGYLLGGSVVVETIFQWPGLGYAAFQAINSRDYPIAQGVVLFAAIFFALITLLVDILYALIDPRIQYD